MHQHIWMSYFYSFLGEDKPHDFRIGDGLDRHWSDPIHIAPTMKALFLLLLLWYDKCIWYRPILFWNCIDGANVPEWQYLIYIASCILMTLCVVPRGQLDTPCLPAVGVAQRRCTDSLTYCHADNFCFCQDGAYRRAGTCGNKLTITKLWIMWLF